MNANKDVVKLCKCENSYATVI